MLNFMPALSFATTISTLSASSEIVVYHGFGKESFVRGFGDDQMFSVACCRQLTGKEVLTPSLADSPAIAFELMFVQDAEYERPSKRSERWPCMTPRI